MSTIKANAVIPDEPSQNLTLGASGDTISVAGNDLRVNTVKDSGGNILWSTGGTGTVSNLNVGLRTDLVLLQTQPAQGVTSVSFNSPFTSAYDSYCFKWTNVHPTGSTVTGMYFGATTDTGDVYLRDYDANSAYGAFYLTNPEGSASAEFGYWSGGSNGNHTSANAATMGIRVATNTAAGSGDLWLFDTNSTTQTKSFYGTSTMIGDNSGPQVDSLYFAGYYNTILPITGMQFTLTSSRAFDDGIIKMYGLRK